MGRVIRIGFLGAKRVGNTIGRVHRQKTARRIPGSEPKFGRDGAENLRATCRLGPPHCRVQLR